MQFFTRETIMLFHRKLKNNIFVLVKTVLEKYYSSPVVMAITYCFSFGFSFGILTENRASDVTTNHMDFGTNVMIWDQFE